MQADHLVNLDLLSDACHELGMKEVMRRIELALIEMALASVNQNCTHAAELLGIERTTLIEKRKKLGLAVRKPC